MFQSLSNFRNIFGPNPFKTTTPEYYEWKISKNPYQEGHIYLESRDGIVVGSTTVTPKRIHSFGKTIIGAEIGDSYTHPNYRRQGIFSRAVNECTGYATSHGIDFLYATPTAQSDSLLGFKEKLGYPPCEHSKLKLMTKYVHLLPVHNAIFRKYGKNIVTRMLACMYFYFITFRYRISKQVSTISITRANQFPEELDGLWGAKRDDYAFYVIRDHTYLHWRFIQNPDEYIVFLAELGGLCVGYLVAKLSKVEEYCVGTLCDFATEKDRCDVFSALLSKAQETLVECGAHYIQVICVDKSPYYATLCRAGYGSRDDRPVVVFSGTAIGKQVLQKDARWYFTIADSDII